MGQAVSADDVKKEAVKFFTKTFGARFQEKWLTEWKEATNEHDSNGNEWHKIREQVDLSLGPDTIQSSKYPEANRMTIYVPNKWGGKGYIRMSAGRTILNQSEHNDAPTLKAMTTLLAEYFKPPPAVGAHAILLRMCDLLEA
jgi:hypothetical protein